MHVVVPTFDFIRMLNNLKPLKTLVTTGFEFAVYTLETQGSDKLKLIVGDGTNLMASTEIFADVKKEGKLSVNGNDFLQLMSKIHPDARGAGSKEIELKTTSTKLHVKTYTNYVGAKKAVENKREFSLLTKDLVAKETLQKTEYEFKIKAVFMSEIFKVLSRMVSAYTSDIAGLSGVLLRVKDKMLRFVVSDGKRILEVFFPEAVNCNDVDVILPKITCLLLQTLLMEGDTLKISYDGNRQIKFEIDTQGLKTVVMSGIIVAYFPPYESIFNNTGEVLTMDVSILTDNITNIRRAIDDEAFRIHIKFDGDTLALGNYNYSDGHINFSNSNIPVVSSSSSGFEVLLNAFLLESLISLIPAESITLIIPENQPIILDNCDNSLRVRAALARAIAD